MTKPAFIFPGQGSQTIGMGQDLYNNFAVAKSVFEEIDEALGQKLSTLMFSGDEANLTKTQNAQPAIMAVGMAVVRVIESETGKHLNELASCVAGHSLGEYTALCAANSLSITDCARLLRARGLAMAEAALKNPGGMAAILGLSFAQVKEVIDNTELGNEQVVIANDNCPGQIVVSGHEEALNKVMEAAKAAGAKRAIKLAVAGPFHSPLILSAAEKMKDVLACTNLKNPSIPIVANVTGQFVQNANDIKELLFRQVTGSVLWTDSLKFISAQGITNFVECGNGKILAGLVKKTLPEAGIISIGNTEEVKVFLNGLESSLNKINPTFAKIKATLCTEK